MEERYVFQGVHMLLDGQPNGTWGQEEEDEIALFSSDVTLTENHLKKSLA